LTTITTAGGVAIIAGGIIDTTDDISWELKEKRALDSQDKN